MARVVGSETMLMLDEAVAKYDGALDEYTQAAVLAAIDSERTTVARYRKAKVALDAAVRDAALAVSDLQYNHGQAVAQKHIDRLLGPEKASE